eukprot:jgi/Galph1/4434/GphlegSOOS_G3056.1
MFANEQWTLNSLPECILFHIAGFLCLKDFVALASVSKRYLMLCHNYFHFHNSEFQELTDYWAFRFTVYSGKKTGKILIAPKKQILCVIVAALEKAHIDVLPMGYVPHILQFLFSCKLKKRTFSHKCLLYYRYLYHEIAKEHAVYYFKTYQIESFQNCLQEVSIFTQPHCLGKLTRSVAVYLYRTERHSNLANATYAAMVDFISNLTKKITNYWKVYDVFRYLDGITLLTCHSGLLKDTNFQLIENHDQSESQEAITVDSLLLSSLLMKLNNSWQSHFTTKYIQRLYYLGDSVIEDILCNLAECLLYQEFAKIACFFPVGILADVLRKVFVRNQLGPRAASTYINSVTMTWNEQDKQMLIHQLIAHWDRDRIALLRL